MIYLKLFWEFFKIGLFTFGGGYAMIPLIKDAVFTNSWLTEEAFYDFIGVCESTPGPIAVNMATYVGATQAGILGSIVATLGVVLPSFIIILLVASILKRFIKNKYVTFFLNGIKPVVIGLIVYTGLSLAINQLGYESIESWVFTYKELASIIILNALVIIYFFVKLVFKKKINSILLIIISAVLGILVCMILA